MPNIHVKGYLLKKLLPGHTHPHTHTGQIALPGPLKWSAKLHKYQYVELVVTAVIVTFGNPSFKWLGFATGAVELLDRRILVVL